MVTSKIAQVVERLRRMQEVAGSNLTFFQELIRVVYLLFFFSYKTLRVI